MSYDEERKLITQHFVTKWEAGSNTKIRRENDSWDAEESVKGENSWVSITIVTGPGDQIELRENALHRYTGSVIIQIFTKMGVGSGLSGRLADEVITIFRRETLKIGNASIRFLRPPTLVKVGDAEGWFQVNVAAPFIRDSYHALPI